jgi:hypothetical protein
LTNLEIKYALGSETEPTDIDNDFDELIEDIADIEDTEGGIDYIYLLADKVHPSEYYLK